MLDGVRPAVTSVQRSPCDAHASRRRDFRFWRQSRLHAFPEPVHWSYPEELPMLTVRGGIGRWHAVGFSKVVCKGPYRLRQFRFTPGSMSSGNLSLSSAAFRYDLLGLRKDLGLETFAQHDSAGS